MILWILIATAAILIAVAIHKVNRPFCVIHHDKGCAERTEHCP